jgi:hypothetical protein
MRTPITVNPPFIEIRAQEGIPFPVVTLTVRIGQRAASKTTIAIRKKGPEVWKLAVGVPESAIIPAGEDSVDSKVWMIHNPGLPEKTGFIIFKHGDDTAKAEVSVSGFKAS